MAQEAYVSQSASRLAETVPQRPAGADTLVIIAAPRPGCQAIRFQSESGWKPLTLVTNLSSAYPVLQSVGLENAKGIITSDFLKPIVSDQKSGDEGAIAISMPSSRRM
jgi:hypothetical protein